MVKERCLPENLFVGEEGSSILIKKLRMYTSGNRRSHETEPNMCPKGGRCTVMVIRASINCSSNETKIASSQLHGAQDVDATQLQKNQRILTLHRFEITGPKYRQLSQLILSTDGLYFGCRAEQKYSYLGFRPKALTNTRRNLLQCYCDPPPTICLRHAYLNRYLE